jgi:fido (protein-threonine AMPylation protein)
MPDISDPYTYPETNVLRNILDIRDPEQLAAFEANVTAARLIELDAAPLPSTGISSRMCIIGPVNSGCQ